MLISRISATHVQVPYQAPVGPYIGRGGGPGSLGGHGLIVRVESADGLVGWGEGLGVFATDPEAVLKGRRVGDIEGACAALEAVGIGPGPLSGVEMALWDLVGKRAGLPLCEVWGGRLREEAEFTACMGLKEPSESAATAREYRERWGFYSIKTKAGDDATLDLAIAAAVQQEIGDQIAFRPDANAGYEPDDAVEQMRKMKDLGVEHFEDPCAREHLDHLHRIRTELGVAVLVNMGIGKPDSVADVLVAEAADFLMPDTPASGSLLRVRQVTAVAEGFGVPCLMHCAHDLGLKTAAITHVAAATPNFSGPSDTCYHGLVDDILAEQLVFHDGKIKVPDGPGLGVEVDEAKLEKYSTN